MIKPCFFPFQFSIIREQPDSLALSSEAIDKLRGEMFTQALSDALLEAIKKIPQPRVIIVKGVIEVSE